MRTSLASGPLTKFDAIYPHTTSPSLLRGAGICAWEFYAVGAAPGATVDPLSNRFFGGFSASAGL